MAIFKTNMVDIDLAKGQIHRSFRNHSIGTQDQQADRFGIRVFRDGEEADLTGVTVQGVFMPPQGSPIAITGSTYTNIDGNTAEVILPQACYNYEGKFTLAIKLVDSGNSVTGTMRIVDGMVDNTHASGTVAPTSAVPTYQEILAVFDDMLDALADYQEMVDEQNEQIYDLESAFDATLNPVEWAPTIKKGEYIKISDGSTASSNKYARTNSLWNGYRYRTAVVLTNPDYEFCVGYYDSTGALDGTGYLGNGTYVKGISYVPKEAVKIGVSFRRADQANLSDADITAISAALSAYAPTDTELSARGMAADAKVTGEGFEFAKNELDNLAKETYIEKSGFSPGLVLGKYRDFSTNVLTSQTGYAIMASSFQKQQRVAVSFNNSNYQFGVMTYSNSEQGLANLIYGYGWYDSGEMVYLPTNTVVFVIQWKKIDGTAITSEEESALQSGIRIYNLTDTELTLSGKAADAKVTGDSFTNAYNDESLRLDLTNSAGIDNRTPIPAYFVRGSRTNQNSGEYINTSVQYRITTRTKVKVPRRTRFKINDGFRVRRYWFSNGSFVSFDGDYQTGSFVLSAQYEYYINIARVTEDTSETADLYTFASQVWTDNGAEMGLNVVATGDSICKGGRNGTRGFIGDVGCRYVNIGIGGATLSTKVDSSESTDTVHYMGAANIPDTIVKYAQQSSEDWYIEPDAIIADGGINDYWGSNPAPLGSIPTTAARNDTDAAALDLSTVVGGLGFMFYQMIKLFPNAHRFFLITHRVTNRPWTANNQGYTQTDLHDAIVAVCKLYGVIVIDVFNESFVSTTFSQYVSPTPYSDDHSVTDIYYVDSDYVHPLALGYRTGYAPLVKAALQKAVNL